MNRQKMLITFVVAAMFLTACHHPHEIVPSPRKVHKTLDIPGPPPPPTPSELLDDE